MGSFIAQFCALCRKNWIMLWRHRWINLIRALILPVAYAVFFAKAQDFFTTHAVLGPGSITPLQSIPSNLLKHKLVWVPPAAAATNTTVSSFIDTLMSRVLDGVTGRVQQVTNSSEVETACPENFNLLSDCFAAVVFDFVDPASHILNYTLRGDFGLAQVDVDHHSHDDVQTRYLPLQWAIESQFINMSTGTMPPSPLEWEYTNQTNEQSSEMNRLSYLRGIRSLIVLAFFLVFLGVVYQLPGSMASERASSLTSHLDAMGCRKSARVISWHLSISSLYFVAWLVAAVIFQHFIFKKTNAGLFIILYIITGLSLASWTHLVAVPFSNAPTLAAITATFLAIVLAIGALLAPSGSATQLPLVLIFPPMFYVFFTKNLASFESHSITPNILHHSPQGDGPILGLLILGIIDIFLFPLLATWLETRVYGVPSPNHRPWWRRLSKRAESTIVLPEDVAVQLEHLRKEYSTKQLGIFGRGKPIVAIDDLSFSIPRGKIFCLLGRNGAAKSTTLSAIARLTTTSKGDITYAPDQHIGIASQKDVLWDELTCKQHIKLWRAIKTTRGHVQEETDLDLLARCDLAPKTAFLSKNLSGGQKRKLQLACALAGGSNLLLLDEISSGLDPLSRRAIWKLIIANRGRTTILLTTHFLDEADYLGDAVAILQAPGKLLALDNPVALKHQYGKGYSLSLETGQHDEEVIERLVHMFPASTISESRGRRRLITGSTDLSALGKAVEMLEDAKRQGHAIKYQLDGASIEQVFLDLNREPDRNDSTGMSTPIPPSDSTPPIKEVEIPENTVSEKDLEITPQIDRAKTVLISLTPGRKPSFLLSIPIDAFTIFRKRLLIVRRGWLLPLVGIVVVIAATCIPLFFLADRVQTCEFVSDERRLLHLTYPSSPYPFAYTPPLIAPQSAFTNYSIPAHYVDFVPDNQTFVNDIAMNISNISFGGISLSSSPLTEASLFAWEGSNLENKGLSALNLLNNFVLDAKVGGTSLVQAFKINLDFQYLASPSFLSTAQAMKWIGFFGLGIAIWPAFAVIYPTVERATNVRSNQYSNGASPVSLWLGHLLFEMPAILLVSTVIILVYAFASSQFSGPADLWICFVFYGISGTLYSFLFALFLNSPLAAWALVAGINVITFLLYLAGYLLILTYDRTSGAADHITIVHFTVGLVSPVPNLLRASLVSVNLFGLLCDGLGSRSSKPYSSILQFGGPILYMVVQALFAFGVLVYVDSGSPIPSFLHRRRLKAASVPATAEVSPDVVEETARIKEDPGDDLMVQSLKKRYSGAKSLAVDDVTFGVRGGQTFALIGPNGAGKTTTLACIRGAEPPSAGDVNVNGHSITNARNLGRSYLGVCPQVNAIDVNLTVRQHLWLYGRLKGVPSSALNSDIDALLLQSGLLPRANALATSLSGGNQRKLSLAIALIGDRPVILIDEFSSGVDPFSKREAWRTLADLTRNRAVLMTTHSMEEVDALATRVGIIASRMLAVGTPASLKNRFATYEIHLDASAVDPLLDYLHGHGFEKAHRSLDTATRISVPGIREGQVAGLLAALVAVRSEQDLGEMTLHEASTETAFLEIVRQHNVQEEESRMATKTRKRWWSRR